MWVKAMKVERTATGISGLDSMLSGGIPKGSSILVAGSPGNGKSILAMQFLYNGVKEYNEPGIYVSLDEKLETAQRNFSTFDWDLNKIEIMSIIPFKHRVGDEIRYVVPPEINQPISFTNDFITDEIFTAKRFSADFLRKHLRRKIKKTDAKRVAIDPITSLVLKSNDAFEARQEISSINEMLNDLGCTTIMTTDVMDEKPTITNLGMEAGIMHGVIMLYNIKKSNRRELGLEILKMERTKHSKKTCAMEITDDGMVVHPKKDLFA